MDRIKPLFTATATVSDMSLRPYIALILSLALSSCATFYATRTPVPIAEIVSLSRSGAPPASIIQRIRESRTTYALRGADFAKLKADGVPDAVLDYLQQSFLDDLDLQTRYWASGEWSLGGCSWCYPQPVDVDKLESGFGQVSATPPGRYQWGKPMGTPDWVPYPPPLRSRPVLLVSDIEKMSTDGVPKAEIIQRVYHSRLTHAIGTGGTFTIRTQPAADLSGSLLGLLHDEGVTYPVLDALQGQFLAQFIEAERLRYQNIGQGSSSMH
jgi:hypothetical protein